ncbi:MAG: hypothetical protein AB7O96_03350 [Pseudobdellovibrionaceae bacterium]
MYLQLSALVFTFVFIFVCLLIALEIGFRAGKRKHDAQIEYESFLLGTIEGASLGLVALLLGFSFSAAGARFFERHDALIAEANAIRTSYLRADLFEEPFRENYRKALREYAKSRLDIVESKSPEQLIERIAVSENLQRPLWSTAIAGLRKSPSFDETITNSLNEVLDLHTIRMAKVFRHTSIWVFVVLIICCQISLATMGFGCGLRKHRYGFFSMSMVSLLTMVLWLVIDLDFPRCGFIQIDHKPLIRLQEEIKN